MVFGGFMLKRIVAIIVMCMISLGIILSTRQYKRDIIIQQQEEIAEQEEEEILPVTSFDIWYTYTGYEAYLKYVAEEFEKETGVKVNLVYKDNVDYVGYIEMINSSSVAGDGPDLYITGTAILENLYLSGVVALADTDIVNEDNYANIALDSVSYDGKVCGYPLGYEVPVLAYNTNYISEAPSTFEDIKAYVGYEEDEENTTNFEGISNVFDMESDELLYNYAFIAEYMNIEKDKESGRLDVSFNSEEVKKAVAEYVALKDYFGLSDTTKTYSSIVSDFAAGKTLFAVLNTKIVGNAAFAELNYDIVAIPDFSSSVKVTSMSFTEMIILNPYTDNMDEALKFAKMASFDMADLMYEKCSIHTAKRNATNDNEKVAKLYAIYEESVAMPMYMETEDYAFQVKNTINRIWKGEDVATVLGELQEFFSKKND